MGLPFRESGLQSWFRAIGERFLVQNSKRVRFEPRTYRRNGNFSSKMPKKPPTFIVVHKIMKHEAVQSMEGEDRRV